MEKLVKKVGFAAQVEFFSCSGGDGKSLFVTGGEEYDAVGLNDAEVYEMLRRLQVGVKESARKLLGLSGKLPEKCLFVLGESVKSLLHSALCSAVSEELEAIGKEIAEGRQDDEECAKCYGEPDICLVAFCKLGEAVWKAVCWDDKKYIRYNGNCPFHVLREEEFEELLHMFRPVHGGSVAG